MKGFVTIVFLFAAVLLAAQPPQHRDFLSFQKSFKRVDDAFYKMEEMLKADFAARGFEWPAKYVYIRSFKYDSRLEVWIKNTAAEPYKKFRTYKVCALAGGLGPKRYEGDYQVPEGFYYINEFKPNSQYHLALGVNYPNPSDRMLSDKRRPGGEIFVHGSCVTVGCIPLTDPVIEEVYVLTASTRAAGQDYIPIHVFPVMFKKDKSYEVLEKFLETRADYKPLATMLQKVYYYFEEKKQLPHIIINSQGAYDLLQEFSIPPRPVKVAPPPPPPAFVENTEPRNTGRQRAFSEEALKVLILKHPEFEGGGEAFRGFIDKLGAELSAFMPKGKQRVFIPVEFIVDERGRVTNVVVDKVGNNEMNNLILERFEAMPPWKPALTPKGNPVPRRLTQTIMVDARPEVPKPKEKPVDEEEDF